jgi:serine/threonine protein kinase
MSNSQKKDEKEIFTAAVELKTPAEREAYLDNACGADLALKARITGLLDAREKPSHVLDQLIEASEIWLDDADMEEKPGTVIGRYKLLERIGEGGMAVVYMAEQAQPIRRKVALKIIKLGMDTKQVIARFEAERQALAMMDHANIAKVLDAGATETGRPYFVMELVKGVSITEYCDSNELSTRERLDLFLQVCNAVQHAHQKGIIHRDLKPSNVMVTQRDGKPIPKVIDFGIAKATNQRLTEKTLFTRYAHIIGTPAYMSPEQAELSDLDVDTRTDIYSLGVLLYELLTGATPFSEEELRKAGYIEMQRVIREEEPTKPSTKLSTLGETLTDVAKHRGATPDLLRKAVRGDLDWIVMKSLEKARDRRYDTVSALALDVQRHLNFEPVLARAPTTVYHLRKFLRRHQSQAVAAVAIAVALVTASVILLMRIQARIQFAQAESIRHRKVLFQAQESHFIGQYGVALEQVRSILDSKHVGPEASLLYDRILASTREKVDYFTTKIEANPKDANSYLRRAQLYHYLGDSDKSLVDMDRYRTLLDAPMGFIFGTPTNLGPPVNTPFDEGLPSISSDGLSLYFTSARPGGFSARGEIWVAKRTSTEDEWGPPVNLGPSVNSRFLERMPSISADSLTLYFSSDRADGCGNLDIWQTTRPTLTDQWSPPENLGRPINTAHEESSPWISADDLELYFTSRKSGDYDLYVSRRATTSDKWGDPTKLAVVNTVHGESAASLSSDGLTLFVQSGRPGGFGEWDLYMTTRRTKDAEWSALVNLGEAVNTQYSEIRPCISFDGRTLYFCGHPGSNPRAGGMGGNDIWKVSILPAADFNNSQDLPGGSTQSKDGKEVP